MTTLDVRKPEPGDLDAILNAELPGLLVDVVGNRLYLSAWAPLTGAQPPAEAGRDCPACVCLRDRHDGYGCSCGCAMPIALVTRSLYRRTT